MHSATPVEFRSAPLGSPPACDVAALLAGCQPHTIPQALHRLAQSAQLIKLALPRHGENGANFLQAVAAQRVEQSGEPPARRLLRRCLHTLQGHTGRLESVSFT